MKVRCLLIEPDFNYSNVQNNSGMHLGLLKIASALKVNFDECQVDFFSFQLEKLTCASSVETKFISVLQTFSPTFCFLSSLTCQFASCINIAGIIKKYSNAKIVLGGPFPTENFDIIERHYRCFDFITCGEGEYESVSIINFALGKSCKKKNSLNALSGKEFLPADLSVFPNDLAVRNNLYATLETARGCPYACKFCARGSGATRTHRYISSHVYLNELNQIVNYGYKKVIITDDTFIATSEFSNKISRLFQSVDQRIHFYVLTRVDTINRDSIKKLKDLGVEEILFGVEHSSSSFLAGMNKTNNPEKWSAKVEEALQLCSDFGIVSHPVFMLGWPGENDESLNDLVEFALKVGSPKLVEPFVSFTTPHPGSWLWKSRTDLNLNLFPTNLTNFNHLVPVCYPSSLGGEDAALEKLLTAHNCIRQETGGLQRNHALTPQDVFIEPDLLALKIWDTTC